MAAHRMTRPARGFSLVEVLVALVVMAVGLLGIAGLYVEGLHAGRTAVYRRTAVLPLLDDLLSETFFGRPVISGDDKALTLLVQGQGWKVRYQETACVYTPGATEMPSFLKQRLRWARNSWRADLKALFSRWIWRRR